jgi:hypothetical protein
MAKLFVSLIVIFSFTQVGFSQSSELFVHGEAGKLYLVHKVVPKENWYSVGRLFNASPKEIAPFNASVLTNPLSIGQELKIPLTETNFSQDGQKNDDETFVPVYHTLSQKETIYQASLNYNAVPVGSLETWNNIKKENAKPGSRIIIGYMKVKTSLSAFAANGKNVVPVASIKEPANDKSTTVAIKETKTVSPPEKKQSISEPVNNTASNTSSIAENKSSTKNTNSIYRSNSGGYFIGEYNGSNTAKTGIAGTFKSTSGWQDGKYYALMNNVQVGTIVKIIAPATQKSVYAKVLGQLPDMKESEGLVVRISSAAANELSEAEGKFNVEVRY